MDTGGSLGSAAKGSAIDLEVAGSGPVSCHFFIPFSFLPCVRSSLACLSMLRAYSCACVEWRTACSVPIPYTREWYTRGRLAKLSPPPSHSPPQKIKC